MKHNRKRHLLKKKATSKVALGHLENDQIELAIYLYYIPRIFSLCLINCFLRASMA